MIKGIGASEGISIGRVYKYEQTELVIEKRSITDTVAEKQLFQSSLEKSVAELKIIQEKTAISVDEETAAIFGAHIEILGDPELVDGVQRKIDEEHVNADYAMKAISDQFVAMFDMMEDGYFKERAADIKDVSKRVLLHIQGHEAASLSEIDSQVIVVAKDLSPSDTAQLNKALVLGFITDIGGRTSHSAIMARTLEIPAVVGTKDGFEQLCTGDLVILNGMTGEVVVNPDEATVMRYKEQMAAYEHEKELWAQFKDKSSLTADGKHIEIGANIGSPEDLEGVLKHGGECIGLYRTEFLYMGKSDYPNEEEQYEAYKNVLEGMSGKPVVVRTLDIGGDKELSYMTMDHELNPFLGNRALRLCMNKPEMFKVQIRALLRASVHGDLHIMFPMIATLMELREAKAFLANVTSELLAEGVEVGDFKVGIMVEIPAAAVLAGQFAKEVDFFSIGTNDLIQYTFAADRMNEKVSYLYQPFNPALLNLINNVIVEAHKAGKWVGMCGEMAGEIKAMPILLGLGLDEFSMSAPSMLKARHLASKVDTQKAKVLAKQALASATQEEVLTLVDQFLEALA